MGELTTPTQPRLKGMVMTHIAWKPQYENAGVEFNPYDFKVRQTEPEFSQAV